MTSQRAKKIPVNYRYRSDTFASISNRYRSEGLCYLEWLLMPWRRIPRFCSTFALFIHPVHCRKITYQIANILGSSSIRYRSDIFASTGYLICIDPRFFVSWVGCWCLDDAYTDSSSTYALLVHPVQDAGKPTHCNSPINIARWDHVSAF